MTPQSVPNPEPPDADAAAAYEPLPQQELFYRAPARFGNVPVEAEPKGWDRRQGFRKHYPLVNLPMQVVEQVRLGYDAPHEPNRLIWGDNLHIMRQIATSSVDLIYIDPPFFSGRNYNVIWGDNNELRVPLGRIDQGDGIARMAAFLASPESDYVTGLSINVPGGSEMS